MTDSTVQNVNLRVVVCGGVDAGKSTLIGVLTHNVLDNGNGYARSLITRYAHELESRHTSNISYNYIRYPNREITILDMAGHEEYFKTTIFGISGHNVDYGIVTVGANLALNDMTRQHLILLLWLNIPCIIVMSKVDICDESIYKDNRKRFRRFLSSLIPHKSVRVISDEKYDTFFGECSNTEYFDATIPILTVSAKLGTNLDKIHDMFKLLTPRNEGLNEIHIPTSIKTNISILSYIECVYSVKNTGIVITGYLSKSCTDINIGQQLYIGPFGMDKLFFIPIVVRGLHDNYRQAVRTTKSGQGFSANIRFPNPDKKLSKKQFRKGLILTSDTSVVSKVSRRFIAKIKIIDYKTAVNVGYSPVIHYRTICQAARIIEVIDTEEIISTIQTSDGPDVNKECKTTVLFEFLQRPEFIEPDITLFFRDGTTKGVGKIISVA